jgi:dTDP-glucose pyrophosphorylase
VIDKEGLRAVMVVDSDQRLLGMVTDGDVRRAILQKISLEAPVERIMNTKPSAAYVEDSREIMLFKLQALSLYHLPVLNQQQQVVAFETMDSLMSFPRRDNLVMVMAGGMGKRLYPLTKDTPKPLLKVGNKPVLEIVLENFIKNGFYQFCFAVNYKSEMIKDYFGGGERWGVSIAYVEESKRLGTAGALGLLRDIPNEPFFVINADVITNVDFQCLLEFHCESKVEATVCIREQEQVMLYGVVDRDPETHHLKNIIEKPISKFFVNAGIYVLGPSILALLQADTFCDMPDLLMSCVDNNYKVATFPLKEYWLDIGHHQDLQKAHEEYEKVF